MDSSFIDAITKLAGLQVVDSADGKYPVVINQDGGIVALKDHMLAPKRTQAFVSLTSVDSLLGYVYRFKNAGTVIFAQDRVQHLNTREVSRGLCVKAIIDYDKPDAASWREHSAVLTLPISQEWAALSGHSWMPQEQFADWLQDLFHVIAEPETATLIDLVTKFHATSVKGFIRGVDRTSGNIVLTVSEEAQPNQTIKFPEVIEIVCPIFENGTIITVPFSIRYRVQGQVVNFKLYTPAIEQHEKKAIKEVIDAITERSGVPVYIGSI